MKEGAERKEIMILQEMKKIFGIKRILFIVIFAVLYYFLFFQFNVGIPANRSDRVLLAVSLELMEKYGESLDKTEYRDLLENFDEAEESELDRRLKENEEFSRYGIESYGDWITMSSFLPEAAHRSLSSQISKIFTPEESQMAMEFSFRKIYINNLIKAYESELNGNRPTSYYSEIPQQSEKRITERNQEEVYSLIPYNVMRTYQSILPDFTIFLFLSMIFLVVPYSVKDKMEGIPILQYTSRKGCRYYWKKLTAVFISSFILCVIEMSWFALMIGMNHAFSFTGCWVSGFWNPFITFMKLTFGQYLIMSLAYIMVIALCLSMITYGISSYANNYISAIAFQIPAVIFSFVISFGFMAGFAEITQSILLLCLIPCICVLAAVIGNVARFFSIKLYEQF